MVLDDTEQKKKKEGAPEGPSRQRRFYYVPALTHSVQFISFFRGRVPALLWLCKSLKGFSLTLRNNFGDFLISAPFFIVFIWLSGIILISSSAVRSSRSKFQFLCDRFYLLHLRRSEEVVSFLFGHVQM